MTRKNTPWTSQAAESDWKYPMPTRPRAEGYMEADAHKIYWHEYGNAGGEPVIYLHGGPGGATASANARFFNPKHYRIILFDQRGCGKSTPNASHDPKAALTANTTQHLIADIERLRAHLRIKGKAHIFGGSWGSTLALAYAIAHPGHVRTLILRGIYLCRKIDNAYLYQGNAAQYHIDPYDTRLPGTYQTFPQSWKKFVEIIPVKERGDMIKAYARIFAMQPKNAAERKKQHEAAIAWSIWEGSSCFLAPGDTDINRFAEPEFAKAFARIENHYFMNGAFLNGKGEKARDNNYLLTHAGKIAHLPIHIVHGQYDQVCPRFQADALVAVLKAHKARKLNYVVTIAGHTAVERETMLALTHIMDKLV